VGWTLCDKPTISLLSRERIETGNVLTVEPGLYNQAVGGVRLEDVLAVDGKGIFKLSELEIPFEV
jgi:Xaa-Pro aminopeptidase